jgi:cytochrome c-type biogenesis protein CcmH
MSRTDELKAQIAQLDALIAEGTLSGEAGREARAKLEAELVGRVLQGQAPQGARAAPMSPLDPAEPAPARPSGRLLAALAGFVLVFSAAGYAWLGNRAGLSVGPGEAGVAAAAAASAPITAEQIDAMLQRLVERLKQQPDDVQGWTMLGRSYSILGRFDEAVPAFQRLVALRPQDAQAHADLADAMASAAGGNLQGEPARLIDKALQLDPRNLKALALAGSLAFNQGNAAEAVRRWEAALALAEPGSEMAQQLQGVVDEADRKSTRLNSSHNPASRMPSSA